MNIKIPLGFLAVTVAFWAVGTAPASAQNGQATGKLKIHVIPKQAYVFVDGKAIGDGSQTIALSGGSHTVSVDNYGYSPQIKNVDITLGKTTELDVTLQASGNKVNGPFGDIELKGHPRAAVLLNGTTPAYFVGHVDEFDNNWIWHQWLLVKPGDYQVTATEKGQTVWSGPVTVKAGERVIVDLNHNGATKTKDFKRGLNLGPEPRFEAGIASAMAPIRGARPRRVATNQMARRASRSRACSAFRGSQRTSYRPATNCIVELKSRVPRAIEYGIAEVIRPKNTPATRPVVNASSGWGLENNKVSTKPMKRPSQAPLITPPPNTFGQVSRPVTRSTCIRSTPTIVTCCTGNC